MKQIFYKLFENLKQLGIKPSIGSRTNVTPIPGSEIDRIINRPVAPKEFDYSKPEVVDSIRGIVKNASDYVGQFTERQAKTFNDNIERILNVIKPKETTADVVDLATKEKITGPGLESLMKEKGVPSISRKTIEAETLIKQFLDDDLISLNAKQIDQLSRGKAEDVFENIFGSKAKELITGKNTNESLSEVYNKLRTTKDVKGRLPDDPSFDPSDIEFKEGGSVSEDVRQLLKEEFIKIINENPEAYPDTNAGFRRFLKRKGAPVFNYKDGGRTGYSNGTSLYDKEFDKNEDGQITYDEFLNKSSEKNESSSEQENLVNRITGGKIKIGADLATKNPKDPFNKIGFGERNPKDPRLGIEFIEDPADERSSRIGISIGPKGGGITFMKPFSEELIDEENMSSKMTDEELIQNYINFAKNVWGMKVTEDEARKTLGIYKIPDTNVRDLIIPKKKDGGRIVKRRQEKKDGKLGPTDPLSKYESYSEEELAGNIEAKKPTFDTLEDYIMETMPMFVPRDVAPPKSYSPMPVEEYLTRRLFIDLADGGEVKSFEEQSLNKKGYETKGLTKKEIFDLYDSVMGTFSKRYKKGGEVKKRKRYADGGVASMFRERPGYAEGGYTIIDPFSTSLNNAQFQLEKSEDGSYQIIPSGKSIITSEGSYTLPNFSPGEYVLKDFGDRYQLVSAQDLTPPTPAAGYTEEGLRKIAEDTASREQAMANAFNNIPTIDPFSGQQVSMQDQMAFTQPQADIFPTLNLGSADPLTNILGSQVGNLSYSEMNALRNRPSDVLSANVGANLLQGLGTGLRDFAYVGDKLGTDYYKNLAGNFFENIKNLDKGFSYDPTYAGADKTGRLGYYTQGIKSLLGMNTPGSNVGGGTPGMRYAIEQISPYLSKTVGPVLNVLGSAPVTAFGILDTLTGSANAPEVGKGPEYFRQQLQLPENSPVSRFNQVQDPRTMMSYGGRVSMSNGGLTNTIPPVRGPSPQGVESLFTRRYN